MEESILRWPTDKERVEKEEVCSIGEVPHILTYLLTYTSSTIGCANFGPDWPLLFKVHQI